MLQFKKSQLLLPELYSLTQNKTLSFTDDFGVTSDWDMKDLFPLGGVFDAIKNIMKNSDEHFHEYHPFCSKHRGAPCGKLTPRSLAVFFIFGDRKENGSFNLDNKSIRLQGKCREEILKQLRMLTTPLHRDYQKILTKFHSRSNYTFFSKLFTMEKNELVSEEFKSSYTLFRDFFTPFGSSGIPLDLNKSKKFFATRYKELLDLLIHMNGVFFEKNKNFINITNILLESFCDAMLEFK